MTFDPVIAYLQSVDSAMRAICDDGKATTCKSAERTRQGQDRGSASFGEEVRFDMEPPTLVGG